jgi:hypothetical protein
MNPGDSQKGSEWLSANTATKIPALSASSAILSIEPPNRTEGSRLATNDILVAVVVSERHARYGTPVPYQTRTSEQNG